MPFFELLILAVALAMDAFAVSLCSGLCLCFVSRRQSFMMAFSFGFFQFIMPVAGWYFGSFVYEFTKDFAGWISFVLLSGIGLKMILESRGGLDFTSGSDPTRGLRLFFLSVATSIDALAVGVSFAMLKLDIWFPAVIIGIVAFVFTLAGLYTGCRSSRLGVLKRYSGLVAGLVLIGIGVNILL